MRWPIIDDVINMLEGRTYNYEYEYSQADMQKLLRLSKESGWLSAIHTVPNIFGEEWQEYFIEYNSSKSRAPWLNLIVNNNNEAVVLDYGCGFGAISYIASSHCNTIVSVDASLDRVRFWSTRVKQEGIKNVVCVAWDGKGPSPFSENSFDAILLNGVLEWIPECIRDVDPLIAQFNSLKYFYDLLKDDGKLFLAIENRFALQYFLGSPDHHSELLFATLLPRIFANLYSKIIRKRPYRVYTHSLSNYIKILRQAGFKNIAPYEVFPLYQFPEEIIQLQNEKMISSVRLGKKSVEHTLIRWLSKINIAKKFVFTYAFIASKKD